MSRTIPMNRKYPKLIVQTMPIGRQSPKINCPYNSNELCILIQRQDSKPIADTIPIDRWSPKFIVWTTPINRQSLKSVAWTIPINTVSKIKLQTHQSIEIGIVY